jgi:hypothetical protein
VLDGANVERLIPVCATALGAAGVMRGAVAPIFDDARSGGENLQIRKARGARISAF